MADRTEPGKQSRTAREVSQPMRDRLVRLAYRFLWNREEAEDAAHDALETAQAHEGTLRDADSWWPWVCRIVVQRCRLRGRQVQRWQQHREPYRVEVDRRSRGASSDDLSEEAEALKQLLPQLPPRQYEVTVLRHLQGMSFEEIGDVLGISPATARVHAKAAREGLRDLVARSITQRMSEDASKDGGS